MLSESEMRKQNSWRRRRWPVASVDMQKEGEGPCQKQGQLFPLDDALHSRIAGKQKCMTP